MNSLLDYTGYGGNPVPQQDLLTALASYAQPYNMNGTVQPTAVPYAPVTPGIPNDVTPKSLIQPPGTSNLPVALKGIMGSLNAWLGYKQYGLAKDQFDESKRQFDLNYQAQRKTTNSRLEDRQRARVASNPTAYRSVGEYMKEYGV